MGNEAKRDISLVVLLHANLTQLTTAPTHHDICRLMRSCKYKLEKDLKGKFSALQIDSSCATLTDKSPELKYSKDAVKVQTK